MGVNYNEKKKCIVFCLPEKTPCDSSRSEYARSINSARRLSPGVRVGLFQKESHAPCELVEVDGWVVYMAATCVTRG